MIPRLLAPLRRLDRPVAGVVPERWAGDAPCHCISICGCFSGQIVGSLERCGDLRVATPFPAGSQGSISSTGFPVPDDWPASPIANGLGIRVTPGNDVVRN